MAAYRKFVEELTPVESRRRLLAPGTAVDAVTVVRCPAGADVQLHIGQSGDGIPVAEGDNFADLCGDTGGLYLTIGTSSPGDFVQIVAFFDEGGNLTRGT